MKNRLANRLLDIRIGFFLALRQIKRSTKWSTILIIAVMMLTFLNLVVISGVLVGLIEGAVAGTKDKYTSDIFVSTPTEKQFIENSSEIINIAESLPSVEALSARYTEGGSLEANYQVSRREDEVKETATTLFVGVDPEAEDALTGISGSLVEGSWLEPGDFDQVVLGALLLKRYLPFESPTFRTLEDVFIGSKIRIQIGDIQREVFVKGIIKSKVDEIDLRVFFVDSQLRGMIGRDDFNVDEISIKVTDPSLILQTKEDLIKNGVARTARVQTFEEAQPKFLKDIKDTFALLGTIVSGIGLAVATITIFIVIFINAITRRRQIGIMKAIGINGRAIEISYIFQSIFFAVIGSILGILLLYFVLVPWFLAHPINFPFSDGILVAPVDQTIIKVLVLIVTTVIAGYVPAKIIVSKNTLDSVLGRK